VVRRFVVPSQHAADDGQQKTFGKKRLDQPIATKSTKAQNDFCAFCDFFFAPFVIT
jgi:hypothetical protein